MFFSTKFKCVFLLMSSFLLIEVIPIQLQEGEELKDNNVDKSQLNECLSVQRSSDIGVCFGKEVLNNLNKYDESETFSLATGVSFVRDDKVPRGFGSFLDKDPMDFRSMIEDASNLISKRSLHWDLSGLYPGLVMKIGPTLANGVLEFVMDRRIKDRTYNHQPATEMSTGRLIARSLLVPFLLGFKFQLSTLLPILLGLLLLASKKAFILAKIALLAVTVFSTSGLGSQSSLGGFGAPALSSYTSYDSPVHHQYHGSGGYYNSKHSNQPDYFYREKGEDQSTATPITPDELRDRLERLFITKKEMDPQRGEDRVRNARGFSWAPVNTG